MIEGKVRFSIAAAMCAAAMTIAGCSSTTEDTNSADLSSAESQTPAAADPNPITGVTTTSVQPNPNIKPIGVDFTLKDGSTLHADCSPGQDFPSNIATGGGSCGYEPDPGFLQGQAWYGFQITNVGDFGITQPVTLTIQPVGADDTPMVTVNFNNTCTANIATSGVSCSNGVVQ